MKLGPKLLLAIQCAPGIALQLGGLWWALRPGWQELNLLVGALLFSVGTPLSMLALERRALRLGRRDTWALTALLGPLGPIIVGRLGRGRAKASTATGARTSLSRPTADRLGGIALSALIGLGLIWAGRQWLAGHEWPPSADASRMQAHERLAYQRLGTIAQAQERYRQRDWDGDGKKTYAAFHIHLYQSVDPSGEPVPVGLIPRELGFAMVPSFALDGYVYQSLHTRGPSLDVASSAELRELDPAREWGVAAIPSLPGTSGVLPFIADSSGAIWTCPNAAGWTLDYPTDLAERGWIELRSAAHLAEIQRSMDYPQGPRTGPQ